jgi:ParB/RepB/Spo0J family partition protein
MEEQNMENGNFIRVKAKNIHPSAILPLRTHAGEIKASVVASGVQQPLIVRPIPSSPGEYQLIDGGERHGALDPEQEVYVDVRENATDAEVFKISEATSKRSPRNAAENASFYAAYVEAVKKETDDKGILVRVAKEAQISESELSQYLAINEVLVKLNKLNPASDFTKLKLMGINKLYELTALTDHPKLVEVANEIEEKADSLTVEGVREIVDNMRQADISDIFDMMQGDATSNAESASQTDAAAEKMPLKGLPERVSKMIGQLNLLLPKAEIESFSDQELASPETLKVLQKISLNLRRLLYYVRKLAKEQDARKSSSTQDEHNESAHE